MGIFIGLTPFFGLHIFISVLLAVFLKASKIAACAGAQITNVVTAPFFYTLTYWIGANVTGINSFSGMDFDVTTASVCSVIETAPTIIWAMVVGGIIIGFPLSIFGYYVAYFTYNRYLIKVLPVKSSAD